MHIPTDKLEQEVEQVHAPIAIDGRWKLLQVGQKYPFCAIVQNPIDIFPLTGKADDPGEYYTEDIGLPSEGGYLSSGYYNRPWYYSTPREINFLIQIDYK